MGTLRDNEFITQLTLRLKRRRKGIWLHTGTFSRLSNSQRVTVRGWMGRGLLRTHRRNGKRRPFIRGYRRRTLQTSKLLGTGTQQPRWKRSAETTWRLRRSHQNQRAIVRRFCRRMDKYPSQQTSTAKSESAVLRTQWGSRTSWPQNEMKMVSFCCLIKLVFVMVAIIRQMVAGIELGWTVSFFFLSQLKGVSFTGNDDS